MFLDVFRQKMCYENILLLSQLKTFLARFVCFFILYISTIYSGYKNSAHPCFDDVKKNETKIIVLF